MEQGPLAPPAAVQGPHLLRASPRLALAWACAHRRNALQDGCLNFPSCCLGACVSVRLAAAAAAAARVDRRQRARPQHARRAAPRCARRVNPHGAGQAGRCRQVPHALLQLKALAQQAVAFAAQGGRLLPHALRVLRSSGWGWTSSDTWPSAAAHSWLGWPHRASSPPAAQHQAPLQTALHLQLLPRVGVARARCRSRALQCRFQCHHLAPQLGALSRQALALQLLQEAAGHCSGARLAARLLLLLLLERACWGCRRLARLAAAEQQCRCHCPRCHQGCKGASQRLLGGCGRLALLPQLLLQPRDERPCTLLLRAAAVAAGRGCVGCRGAARSAQAAAHRAETGRVGPLERQAGAAALPFKCGVLTSHRRAD